MPALVFWFLLVVSSISVSIVFSRIWSWLDSMPEGRRSVIAPMIVGALMAAGGVMFWSAQWAWDRLNPEPRRLPSAIAGVSGFVDFYYHFHYDRIIDRDGLVVTNMYFYNHGSTPLRVHKWLVDIYRVSDVGPGADQAVRAYFEEKYRSAASLDQDLAPNDAVWGTRSTDPVNVPALLAGTERIYIIGRAEWTASGETGIRDVCMWMQNPPSTSTAPDELVWHVCTALTSTPAPEPQ